MGQLRLNVHPAHLRGMPQLMKANKPLHPIHIGPFRQQNSVSPRVEGAGGSRELATKSDTVD